MTKFSKYTQSDFESKPSRVDTDKTFEARQGGQEYAAINVCHRDRSTVSDEAIFRIIGIYETVEDATSALAESRSQGYDAAVVKTHTPTLLSTGLVDDESVEKISTTLAKCRSVYETQRRKIEKRVEYTRALNERSTSSRVDQSIDGVHEGKLPVPEEVSDPASFENRLATGARKTAACSKNLDTDAMVVSIVCPGDEEPVLYIYAGFKNYEDAKIYVVNTLQHDVEFDMSIISRGEWHYAKNFAVENDDISNVDYLDEGLSKLMSMPRDQRAKKAAVMKNTPTEDIIEIGA
jgi:hypothetical protein